MREGVTREGRPRKQKLEVMEEHKNNQSALGQSTACLGARAFYCNFKNRLSPFDQFKGLHAGQNRRAAGLRKIIAVLARWHPATLAPQALHIGFATNRKIIRCRAEVGQISSHVDNSFVRLAGAVLHQTGLIILYKYPVFFNPPFGRVGEDPIVPLFGPDPRKPEIGVGRGLVHRCNAWRSMPMLAT